MSGDILEDELVRRRGTFGDDRQADMLGVQLAEDGTYVYTGLSAMLESGLITDSTGSAIVANIDDDFEPQYKYVLCTHDPRGTYWL